MKAYVICCNDAVEFVVLNDESLANSKKEELAKRDFDPNSANYEDYDEYRQQHFWHLHEVDTI